MERVLYTLGVLYRTMRYVQGFNELLAPIYFVLTFSGGFVETEDDVEAIAFHCLHALLTQTRLHELFTTQDGSSILLHRLRQFDRLLERHLPNVHHIVRGLGIHPLCYCFRWFSLLFAQEHAIEDVVVLWTDLFARIDDIVEGVFYVGLGHIKQMENRLDPKDHPTTVRVLQSTQDCDMRKAMEVAEEFRREDTEIRIEQRGWVSRVVYRATALLANTHW
jgi:hypothetical protein